MVGAGNFNRICRPHAASDTGDDAALQSSPIDLDPSAARCRPSERHCQDCDSTGSQCVQCRDAHYLFEGICLSGCPAGHEPNGRGRFNRVCTVRAAIGPSTQCQPRADHCQVCTVQGDACTQCRDQYYLLNGACALRCPVGYEESGRGNFNRVCSPTVTDTAAVEACLRENHCHDCDSVGLRCVQCRADFAVVAGHACRYGARAMQVCVRQCSTMGCMTCTEPASVK